jgi:hypothetical protein
MMLPNSNADPATLLLSTSPIAYIPVVTDVIDELCFETDKETLLYDVATLLWDLSVAERV